MTATLNATLGVGVVRSCLLSECYANSSAANVKGLESTAKSARLSAQRCSMLKRSLMPGCAQDVIFDRVEAGKWDARLLVTSVLVKEIVRKKKKGAVH